MPDYTQPATLEMAGNQHHVTAFQGKEQLNAPFSFDVSFFAAHTVHLPPPETRSILTISTPNQSIRHCIGYISA